MSVHYITISPKIHINTYKYTGREMSVNLSYVTARGEVKGGRKVCLISPSPTQRLASQQLFSTVGEARDTYEKHIYISSLRSNNKFDKVRIV